MATLTSFLKIAFTIFCLYDLANAAPKDLQNYLESSAKQSAIPSFAIVEGLVDAGGIQPDYLIDFKSKEFDLLRRRMLTIR